MWDLLTGIKYEAFRAGYFAGVLMGAHLEGASKEKMDRLGKALAELIETEGFELATKTATKAV